MNRFLRLLNRKDRNANDGARDGESIGAGADSKLGLLKASDLFHGLDDEQMADVERMTVMTQCERGRLVFAAEEASEALFLLKKGKVHLYRLSPEGKRLITAVISSGTLFGNMAFTASSMADTFAEAVEDSVLCVMSRQDLEALILKYPAIAVRLMDLLSCRILELESRLEEGLLRDMRARIAAALLRLSEQEGSDELHVTHQELADSLGTYRETVSHTLGGFQSKGIVHLERSRILIRDAAALRQMIASDARHYRPR